MPICWIHKNIPDRQKCVGFQKRKKYQIIPSYCVCWSRQENTQPAGNIFFFWQRILFINPHYLSWLNSCPQTRAISHVLIREAKSRTTQTQMLNINYVDDFKPTKAWNNFLAQINWNFCDIIFSLPKHGFLGFFFYSIQLFYEQPLPIFLQCTYSLDPLNSKPLEFLISFTVLEI